MAYETQESQYLDLKVIEPIVCVSLSLHISEALDEVECICCGLGNDSMLTHGLVSKMLSDFLCLTVQTH